MQVTQSSGSSGSCVNLNLTAPMLLTQAFAAGMEKKKVRI